MNPADVAVTYVALVSLLAAAVILRSLWRWSAQKVSEWFEGEADSVR